MQVLCNQAQALEVMGAKKNGARGGHARGEIFMGLSRRRSLSPRVFFLTYYFQAPASQANFILFLNQGNTKNREEKSRTKLFSSYWRFSSPLSINLIILVFHVTLFPRIALLHHLMYKPCTTHRFLICYRETPPPASPQNDVCETSTEIPYWWRFTTQIWEELLIGWNLLQPIRNNTQTWVMTRHQYGISALVSQTSFRGETSGDVTKCRLFSQQR